MNIYVTLRYSLICKCTPPTSINIRLQTRCLYSGKTPQNFQLVTKKMPRCASCYRFDAPATTVIPNGTRLPQIALEQRRTNLPLSYLNIHLQSRAGVYTHIRKVSCTTRMQTRSLVMSPIRLARLLIEMSIILNDIIKNRSCIWQNQLIS